MEKELKSNEKEDHAVKNLLSFECPDGLNIAVVGKTGVGKSSFINAFRNLTSNDQFAAKEGAGAEPIEIEVKMAKFCHKVKVEIENDNVEIEINFYDTMGFMDNKNTDIEKFLKQIKQEHHITEFTAIIFVTAGKLSDKELQIAKEYESKNVMLFFIYNQVDKYLENQIKNLTGKYDKKRSFEDQYNQNKHALNDLLEKETNSIYEIISNKLVFNSLLKDINSFDSNILKATEYKEKLIKKSIYLITSNSDDFFNPDYSRDGMRLKKEIEEHLVSAILHNFNIDLLDKFSQRTICLKKKYILMNMFSGLKKNFKLIGNSIVNNVPLLDTILGYVPYLNKISEREMRNTLKIEFMVKFGIKDLQEKLSTNPGLISTNSLKIKKLENIMKKIENDEIIKNLDFIAENLNSVNSSNIKEKVKDFIQKILPPLGIGLAGLGDDILKMVAPITGGLSKFTTGLLAFLAIATIPVTTAIYFFLLRNALLKILLRYEEYALLIFEVLHEHE